MPSLPAPEPSPCNPLPGPLPLPMPDSAAAAAEASLCSAARRHGDCAAAVGVRQSRLRSRLAGDDDRRCRQRSLRHYSAELRRNPSPADRRHRFLCCRVRCRRGLCRRRDRAEAEPRRRSRAVNLPPGRRVRPLPCCEPLTADAGRRRHDLRAKRASASFLRVSLRRTRSVAEARDSCASRRLRSLPSY